MVSLKQPEPADDDATILPARLLHGGSRQEGYDWYASHRIDPLDAPRVKAIRKASAEFHRLPLSAMDRAWAAQVGLQAWRQARGFR